MVPPKKKRKVVLPIKPDDDTDSVADAKNLAVGNGETSTKATAKAQISRVDLLTKELISQLETLESSGGPSTSFTNDSGVSVGLLKLKSLQRGVLEGIRKKQEVLRQQAILRDQQEAKLDNLHYQDRIYQARMQESDRSIESISVDIADMVRRGHHHTNAVGDGASKDDHSSGDTDDDAELLRKFFGDNWKDPSRKQAIVTKLNHEVVTREKLEALLKKLTVDRKSKQDSLASRERLLRDLPAKLADMERASLPLQKFFQKHQRGTLMRANPQLGTTQRRKRLDLAKALPQALYTLFHQLQSCLDAIECATNSKSQEKHADIAPEALPTVEIERSSAVKGKNGESDAVVLKIPIPTRSSGGEPSYRSKKQASIGFRYYDAAGVILAVCGPENGMGQFVIDELFPGDTGGGPWAVNTKQSQSPQASSSPPPGRAYQWCNYLGGLHSSPADQTTAKMHSSARVIVRALLRRIRATATLSWIVHDLSSRPSASKLPRHAGFDDRQKNPADTDAKQDPTEVRLTSWKALPTGNIDGDDDDDGDGNDRRVSCYRAILQKGSGKTSKKLAAKVSIDLARYPSRIPRWEILRPNDSDGEDDEQDAESSSLEALGGEAPQQLPLYDEARARYNKSLAKLEEDVNGKVDQLVDSSDQTTYDWIFAHQLVLIAKGWENALQEESP